MTDTETNLTEHQERFVHEYLVDLNGTRAYLACFPRCKSEKAAATGAWQLLRNPEIAALVAKEQAKRVQSADLSADRVLEEMRRLAFSDIRDLFDDAGNLRPLKELTADQAAAIASVEVVIKNAKAGDGQTDTVHKIRFWDKTRTLEQLGKHFALLTDHVRITDDANTRVARLMAARKRTGDE